MFAAGEIKIEYKSQAKTSMDGMKLIEDQDIVQAFVTQLEKWGCQVLRAVNRSSPGPHPAILPWNKVTKKKKLEELLNLWKKSGDILEKRRRRLGVFYKYE